MIERFGSFLAVVLAGVEVRAQTIQLPSFRSFGINTTVVVPDSGAGYAARDRRASYGTSRLGGVPRNRGWSISLNAAGVAAAAQIHDPRAADEAIAGARRAATVDGAPTLRTSAGPAARDAPLAGVAELEGRRAEQERTAQRDEGREAAALLEKARRAQAAGKASLAAIYYRMAAAQADGPLKRQIDAERRAPPPRAAD